MNNQFGINKISYALKRILFAKAKNQFPEKYTFVPFAKNISGSVEDKTVHLLKLNVYFLLLLSLI